ncbi:hypothetical protein Hanom_Chr01g00023981 [Helianthus anomalus]
MRKLLLRWLRKKSKPQKENATAPSESEIDLGVFSEKTAPKSGRSRSKIGISKITPPASPSSKSLDLSPPRSDPKGKGKEYDVEVHRTEKLVEDAAAGARRDEAHAEGVETEVESSEATPKAPFILNVCGVLEEVVHLALIKV